MPYAVDFNTDLKRRVATASAARRAVAQPHDGLPGCVAGKRLFWA